MEEVATMESYTMTRPSMLLTAACAPSAVLPSAAAPVALLAAERAPISRVHQVQVQAELARVLVLAGGINGTTGFLGSVDASKRYADGGSGLPPRGRPV
jgi:hypothetical protein